MNDVALTIVCGAMQRYLEAHGQPTEGVDLRIMAPFFDESFTELRTAAGVVPTELPVLVSRPRTGRAVPVEVGQRAAVDAGC